MAEGRERLSASCAAQCARAGLVPPRGHDREASHADEHISILEDNYDPAEDAEALTALPKRKAILPPCMKQKP
jgi:hypothetical protein